MAIHQVFCRYRGGAPEFWSESAGRSTCVVPSRNWLAGACGVGIQEEGADGIERVREVPIDSLELKLGQAITFRMPEGYDMSRLVGVWIHLGAG